MAIESSSSGIAVHYACPCTDITRPLLLDALDTADQTQQAEEESVPFNAHNPRAELTLYPLEHLLFCTECNDFRCPRCWYEEALTYFCPSCLHERTSTSVKTERNTYRISRCPVSSMTDNAPDVHKVVMSARNAFRPSSSTILLPVEHWNQEILRPALIFSHVPSAPGLAWRPTSNLIIVSTSASSWPRC